MQGHNYRMVWGTRGRAERLVCSSLFFSSSLLASRFHEGKMRLNSFTAGETFIVMHAPLRRTRRGRGRGVRGELPGLLVNQRLEVL